MEALGSGQDMFLVSQKQDQEINTNIFCLQVLEDGSVVHINKTTISDTDEDGNRCNVRFAWIEQNNIEKLALV